MQSKFDVIAIGDTTQDIFLDMSDASVQCDLDGHNCRICFDYADKIGVEKKTDVSAVGNAANHAIGVARLGLRAGVYTVVGDDTQGEKAEKIFKENGVDTSYVAVDEERGTNLSIVINYKGERTIFVYHEPRTYKLPEMAETRWVYLTSASGDGVLGLHEQMLEWLEAHPEVKVAFNPGTYQIALGLAGLKPLLERVDWLFLNREEGREVLGIQSRDVKDIVGGFHEVGVKGMVLTDGPKGSYAWDGQQIYFSDIFKGEVVERTGAGDAYGSGFLSAVLAGKSVPEAMGWGNGNSTSVLQHIGAREGLLTPEEMRALVSANQDVQAHEWEV